jgi:hypothetical protein
MRNLGQKLLSFSLLALYGGIALLGHGLHEFAPHHHADVASHSHAHPGCSHAHHHHHHAPAPETPGVTDHHDCEVCALLDQHRGEQPSVATEIASQPLVTQAVTITPQTTGVIPLGPTAPRGPPAFAG